MWEVEFTDEFEQWRTGLDHEQQEALTDRIDLLAERGLISAVRSSTGSSGRGITT